MNGSTELHLLSGKAAPGHQSPCAWMKWEPMPLLFPSWFFVLEEEEEGDAALAEVSCVYLFIVGSRPSNVSAPPQRRELFLSKAGMS